MEMEKGLKIVKLENCSSEYGLDSKVNLCLGLERKNPASGAITNGKSIFRLGLNISLDAILDMYVNKINIPPRNTRIRV